MARKTVPLVNGEIYHIFNRGSNKREIFLDKWDFLRFYNTLTLFNCESPVKSYRLAQSVKHTGERRLVSILAYSLLPNHFHLLLEQEIEGGVSEFLKRLVGGYTSYFNERYERSGVLFDGTYKRVLVTRDAQFNYLFNYVNENHYVHEIPRPEEIIYSSSLHYQKKISSKAIAERHSSIPETYNLKSAIELAKDIYRRRKEEKHNLTLE